MEAYVRRLRERLQQESDCNTVEAQIHAGVYFLYVTPAGRHWGKRMKEMVPPLIKDTDISFEYRYVRRSKGRDVYRIHFRVPDEKSFCCGNSCIDCILLRPKKR